MCRPVQHVLVDWLARSRVDTVGYLMHRNAAVDRTHADAKIAADAFFVDEKGDVHKGCNVENAAYPEGNCAEANAIGAMVAAGGKKISVIAAVGGSDTLEFCTPCGGCRQSILEFSDEKTRVILINEEGQIQKYSIEELLPLAFRLRQARL